MFLLVYPVIDENWAVNKLTYMRAFPNLHTYTRKSGEQLDMTEHGVAKATGGLGVVLRDLMENFGEIAQRLFRVEETVVHFGRSSRAFSAGSTRPASASRMPSSMAAIVSSSSSSSMGVGSSRSNFLGVAMDPS